MKKISHIALNVQDIQASISFFTRYFDAEEHLPHYFNPKTGLQTCFLSFSDGSKIELMKWPDPTAKVLGTKVKGYIHIAFSVGSREAVNDLTTRLKEDGVTVISGPRVTGDGYYESLIQDAEGNLIEITI